MTIADKLTSFFASRGCAMPEIATLQPADPFLETAGEDLRRRIFMTENEHGAALCLRPEFTIPVCLHHMLGGAENPRRYAYCGTVFRQQHNGSSEFFQAGIEDLSNSDMVGADIDCLADAYGALAACGVENCTTVLGDQAIFETIVAALGLPKGWQTRLVHAFGDDAQLEAHVARLTRGQKESGDGRLAKFVASGDLAVVEKAVAAEMARASLPPKGGRTAIEIARRAIEKARLAAARLNDRQAAALADFLAIDVPAEQAGKALSGFEKTHQLDLGAAKAGLIERLEKTGARGLPLSAMRYKASFGRRLDYYSGLLFEIHVAGAAKPVIGGGRYDRLMMMLGSKNPVPAVGFSIWVDRIPGSAS